MSTETRSSGRLEPETGVLLIADISGYTGYLAGAEEGHGAAVATDLLTRVVDALTHLFRVNKIEGDAVFAYGRRKMTGPDLTDLLDAVYRAFRTRLISVHEATRCSCAACGLMPALDLKLIAHHGSFTRHRIAGREELSGRDVILAHRLLKNTVGGKGVTAGYALLTAACVDHLGLDPDGEGFTPHIEDYEHFGPVVVWLSDLDARFQRRPAWMPATPPLTEESAWFAAEPAELWPHLVPGRSDACVTERLGDLHGVVDWTPFDRMVVEVARPEATLRHEVRLEPFADGTRVTLAWYRVRRRRGAPAWADLVEGLAGESRANLAEVAALVSAAARSATPAR